MKFKIFLPFLLFITFSCKKQIQTSGTDWKKISSNIQFLDGQDFFEFQSGKFNYKIPKSKLPFKKMILLNASLVGYFTELEAEDKIIGISSPEYIYSEKIKNLILNQMIQNVGNEQKYDVEKIIALKPDAIFTNYVQSFENTYEILKKNGIEIIFIDEYFVQKPLEKTRIIELFGGLIGEKEKAQKRYLEIENNYKTLQNLALKSKEKPTVLVNEIYGNQWFLPGGKSFVAQYINDASGNYILKNNTDEKAIPLSFEEVFAKSENATLWINAGNHTSKKSLLSVNPNYAQMNVFRKGKIYTVSGKEKGRGNDYFESGVVRSDLVLKDYIKIFHPQLLPDYQLNYMKELK